MSKVKVPSVSKSSQWQGHLLSCFGLLKRRGIAPGHGKEEANRWVCFVTTLCCPLAEVSPHTPRLSRRKKEINLSNLSTENFQTKSKINWQPVLCSVSLHNFFYSSNQSLLFVLQVNVDLGFRELFQHLQVAGWKILLLVTTTPPFKIRNRPCQAWKDVCTRLWHWDQQNLCRVQSRCSPRRWK